MTQLTPHFALAEFTKSDTARRLGRKNEPLGDARANLQRTAETLEKVREILGNHPVQITSGYRSPAINRAVGGADDSAHMSGLAADFVVPRFGSPLAICQALVTHMATLEIDQLINSFDRAVHLGLAMSGAPRLMTLTIDNNGTRIGFA